jgi:NADPH:quinone reductase-like Zn-dependent oxidoreductase
VLGQDFSGEVVACGAAVKNLSVGDAVFGKSLAMCVFVLFAFFFFLNFA